MYPLFLCIQPGLYYVVYLDLMIYVNVSPFITGAMLAISFVRQNWTMHSPSPSGRRSCLPSFPGRPFRGALQNGFPADCGMTGDLH